MQCLAACLGNSPGVLQSGFYFVIDCWWSGDMKHVVEGRVLALLKKA